MLKTARQFLKGNCKFFSVIWVKWKQSVCSIILVYSSTCFCHFLFWRYLNSSMKSFLLDILLSFPNSNDLNSRELHKPKSVTNILTTIIDWKNAFVYIHVHQMKNWEPGLYNSLHHAENRKYFSGLSISSAKSKGRAHVLLGEESGKIWKCFCWEKGNFIMINEFKYGQTWKTWPFPLSFSLYSTFKIS